MKAVREKPPRQEIIPEEDRTTLVSESLETQAREKLSATDFAVLQFIAVAISKDGMTPKESCMLYNVPHEKLIALCAKEPVVARIIEIKELEYKRSLMRALSLKARSGDDKLATMLLESRYPDEFGKKKKGDGDGGQDLVTEAIEYIQNNGDSSGIVQAQKGKKRVIPSTVPSGDAVDKLKSFLV